MIRDSSEMPFWDHLEELRWRLVKSIIAIIICAFIAYRFSDIIVNFLMLPAKEQTIDLNFQVLKVTSMFSIKLSIALFGGIILGLPIILYQIWRFISPAFQYNYGLSVILVILFSSLFFFIGMSFAYYVIIPFSLSFFTSLANDKIEVAYDFTLESYIIYVIWIVFGSGLLFQLPIISTFLTRIGLLTPEFLRQYRKIAIVVFLIISAIITPPDPLSQILMVIPLILLYEFSILISKLFKPSNSLV